MIIHNSPASPPIRTYILAAITILVMAIAKKDLCCFYISGVLLFEIAA